MINKSVVKYIQSLQHKKFRAAHNAFFAEGYKAVTDLLAGENFTCTELYCTAPGAVQLKDFASSNFRESPVIIADFEMEKISALSTPADILGVFQRKESHAAASLSGRITLFLDDIRDPGNLGTIIRTADWFGIENIFCSAGSVDCYNPKVVQSTMGSLGRVNIVYADIAEILQANLQIEKFAAVTDGGDIREAGMKHEAIVIIGNESNGISGEILALADKKISVKKYGSAESLNAAIATGIILFAMKAH